MNKLIQKLLQMWAKSEGKDANARQIAKHLSKVALYELQGTDALYPNVREKAISLKDRMSALGKPIRIFETYRTAHRQDELYAKRPKVTNARGLESWHQYGLAFDCIFVEGNWTPPSPTWWDVLGKEGKALGLTWGGSFGDRPHFEYHPGFEWSELKTYFQIK